MRFRIGSRNAAVLPVPVSAQPMRSSPLMTIGMTALWIGVVVENPRMRMPSRSEASRPSVSKSTGLGSYSACGRVTMRVVGGTLEVRPAGASRRDADFDGLVVLAALVAVLYGNSKS